MKIIDMDLIRKYVNGEELDEYTIEELENNKDFMIGVINYTKDINMYNLCSETLKNDYEFIKYLVLKFKDNYNFIINVADNYLMNNDNDLETRELSIIMKNLLPNEFALKYILDCEVLYKEKILEIEIAREKNPKLSSMVGMGFWLIFNEYKDSEIILKDYAKRLVDEIVNGNNIDLNIMIHSQYKNKEDIEKIGIKNYFLNFIRCYDSTLASYLTVNINIINKYIDEIKNIVDNWDKVDEKKERVKYNKMLEMVHNYIYTTDTEMDETELVYYTAEKLGIKDKVAYYDNYDLNPTNDSQIEYLEDYISENDLNLDELETIEEMLNDAKEETEEYEIDYYIKNSIKERLIYINTRKIMINQIFSKSPKNNIEDIIEHDDKKNISNNPKIIKFKIED